MLGQDIRSVQGELRQVTERGGARVALLGLPPVYRYGLAAGLQAGGLACDTVPDLTALGSLIAAVGDEPLVVVSRQEYAVAVLPMLREPAGAPRAAVLVVDDGSAQAYADALRGGATGVVSTAMELDDAVTVIRCAAAGQTLMPSAVARALCRPLSGPPPALDGRERGWLRTLADGGTVSGLARAVGYSEREMYRLLSGVYARLGATSRTEALLLAERWGLLHEEG